MKSHLDMKTSESNIIFMVFLQIKYTIHLKDTQISRRQVFLYFMDGEEEKIKCKKNPNTFLKLRN